MVFLTIRFSANLNKIIDLINKEFFLNNYRKSQINGGLINKTYNNTILYDISDSLVNNSKNKRTLSSTSTSVDPNKTTCMLYLQADHQFYQKYQSEEACIEVMTRHVQRVNSIYKTTG